MDVICPVCGEAFDHDSLHEEAQDRYGIPYYREQARPFGSLLLMPVAREKNPAWNSDDYGRVYNEVAAEFRRQGCVALQSFGAQHSSIAAKGRSVLARAEYELLGDDMDGAAAMLEDAGL